ncbi:MAG: DUF2235 domain-containing protein [Cyanobacteria bacterium SZAS LIN-2]|nr:DUF2235 domain-containing protein [Cyanobacteria bacterium SZAS LIN-2]
MSATEPPELHARKASASATRRLVILADGTWNKPDQRDRGKRKPTNVSKLARAIVPIDADGRSQIVYYHAGVGTHWSLSDHWLGGGFGVGLVRNIIDLYLWLTYNYADGDEIFLFGFSRGAYSVRSLAGLIDRIGLLPKDRAYYLPEAEALYRGRAFDETISVFREKHHCRTPSITFIGVWDTVGALGVPIPLFNLLSRRRFQFHDVGLGRSIVHARHALAIDERRKPFAPTLWTGEIEPHQTVEQRWFAGVHTNIGGGYEKDGLANVALHWMVQEATQVGLEVDEEFLKPYRSFAGDELRNSMKWYYRILGVLHRPLGQASPATETIDPSVFARYRDQKCYRPPALERLITERGLDVEHFAKAPSKGGPDVIRAA